MKLQLDSKNDLHFVFQGLQDAVAQHLAQRQKQKKHAAAWTSLEASYSAQHSTLPFSEAVQQRLIKHLDHLFEITASNCLVNGREWDSLPKDEVRQTVEPLNEQMEAELVQKQKQVDQLMKEVLYLRHQVPLQMQETTRRKLKRRFEEESERELKETQDQPAIEMEWPEPLFQRAQDVCELVQQLNGVLPPLMDKLNRYHQFAKEELSSETFQQHADRLRLPIMLSQKENAENKKPSMMERMLYQIEAEPKKSLW